VIRNTLRRLVGRRRSAPPVVPYDMFDEVRTLRDVDAARRLERIYHVGQNKAWAGKDVLEGLVDKHGGINLPPDKLQALRTVFAVILWGELAAWKVSAQLALELTPLEAKLAATSQAHDEARHFYVMHDYLDLLGYQPGELPPAARATLQGILTADSLQKKLVGMQLMVEPIALTIFQLVRESKVEPVLMDLLPFYERDEARHVALGINHLPAMLSGMGPLEAFDLWAWQLKMFELEIAGMRELGPAFRVLGVRERDVLRLGMAKQLIAFRAMARELGQEAVAIELFKRLYDFRIEFGWPEDGEDGDRMERLLAAMLRVVDGVKPVDTSIEAA
jgi:hypothetical protein